MKHVHIGLLVLGAALAGGLAVKMTQPPSPPPTARAASPSSSQTPAQEPPAPQPVPALPAIAAPAPVHAPERQDARQETPVASEATAPPAVYAEPAPKPPSYKPVVKPAPIIQIAKIEQPPPASVPAPLPYKPAPDPAPLSASASAPIPPATTLPEATPPPPAALHVTLTPGTQISVRLDQALSSDNLAPGDTFQASLAEPLIANGFIVAERGSRVSGHVVDSQKAGRLSGVSQLQLSLSTIQTADGQKVAISTDPWVSQGQSSRNRDVAKIGGGAALGAIIGAIAGGGKGAAIGAGAGGVIGTGAAASTRGKPSVIPSETIIRFRLASRVSITERQL